MKIVDHAPVELLKRSLTVYSKQQGAIAENVANADNPNFRRLDTDFSEILQGVQESRLATTSARHLPGSTTSTIHLQDNEEERVDINTEMADLAVNQIHFEFSAQALRRMYSGILSSISGRSS